MTTRIKNTTLKEALPPFIKLQRLLISIGVSLALIAGCSSSDDDNGSPVDTDPSMYGFVSVDVDEEEGAVETELVASFIRFNDTTIPSRYVASVAGVIEDGDICFVGDNAEILLTEDAPELLAADPEIGEFLSAGGTLTFTSSVVGTYATLERETEISPVDGSPIIYYEVSTGPLAGVPAAGLTLDIAGDVFPAFSNVTVPDTPAPLSDFSPDEGGPVNESTGFAFTWTPSGVAGAILSLGIDSDTESIDCLLEDDGSFSLLDLGRPQSGLLDNFNGTLRDVDRATVTVEQTDTEVLFITVEDGRDG